MTLAEQLVLHVAQGIQDEDGAVTRTRLLKIIYLIDVEYYRRHRKTLTGWKWVFYHYGPYVHEYPAILERLGVGDLTEAEFQSSEGHRGYSYTVSEGQTLEGALVYSDRALVDQIIRRWALENLNALLNYVYFETEPMQNVERRGQMLGFEAVRPRAHAVQEMRSLPEEKLKDLRQRLGARLEKLSRDREETKDLIRQYYDATGWPKGEYPDPFTRDHTPQLPDGTCVSA